MRREFRKSTLREYFESIVIAVILALFIRTFVVQDYGDDDRLEVLPQRRLFEVGGHSLSVPILSTARNASCGICTRPTCFMRFLPSFCFSRSLRFREMSPP